MATADSFKVVDFCALGSSESLGRMQPHRETPVLNVTATVSRTSAVVARMLRRVLARSQGSQICCAFDGGESAVQVIN